MQEIEYTFGYDTDCIDRVEKYVEKNYNPDDFNVWIGYNDYTMNSLDIVKEAEQDEQLQALISCCDGGGEWEDGNGCYRQSAYERSKASWSNRDEYNKMYDALQSGQITEGEWKYYCTEILDRILEENKDILDRLRKREH